MKYFTVVIASFALLGILVSGCEKKAIHASESQAPGAIFSVGFDADFPPYGFKTPDGSYAGFDLDLAREVCSRNQWQFAPRPIAWEAKDMELNSGAIDCIWNGFTINGRENQYEWTLPYMDNSQVVIVLDHSVIHTLGDLAGKMVAAQMDTPVLAALSKNGKKEVLGSTFKTIVVTPNYNNAVMELETGGVDAIALDIGIAREKMKNGKLRILKEVVFSEQYGVGFKLGCKALRDRVQQTLIEMGKDGTADKIARRYFGANHPWCLTEKHIATEAPQSVLEQEVSSTPVSAETIPVMDVVAQLLDGFCIAGLIFALTLLFSLPLGMLLAFGRMSRRLFLRGAMQFYISVIRGTPLMLQLLAWYFGPYYLFDIRSSQLAFCGIDYRFTAVIIGFSLNYAAYFAEIFRAGVESIPRGQYEAAHVLGYSPAQTFVRIIFPQFAKRVIPPVTNEFITLVKDTSLAFSLSLLEMFTVAKQLASAYTTMLPFVIAGIFYYIFNFLVAWGMGQVEKKLDYYR